MFGLLSNVSFWGYVIFTLVVTHITVIGVTVFLHRSQAHRALDLHPIASHFFRFWLWMTTSIVTKEWVAIHRKHHTTCETPDDPHSPQVEGLYKVLFEGAELYKKEALNEETLARYGKGTPDDWLERIFYAHLKWRSLGIAFMFLIDVGLFGIPGIAIWAIQMMWIPFWAAGVVNGVGHFWGYRNFECADASRNISPIGIIMGGEELHNNHHTFANSAKLSVRWFEFDMGWFYIRLLTLLGLAKVHRSVPKLQEDTSKLQLDIDSLKAIVNSRFQVMDHYWRRVILPVVRNEKRFLSKQARHLLRAKGRLLVREESLISGSEKEALQSILKSRNVLNTVYQFRLQLQDFWHRNTENHAELLENLHNWCKRAEATGITVLQEFARRLSRYSLRAC